MCIDVASQALKSQILSGSSVRAVSAGSVADDEVLVLGSFRIARSLPSRIWIMANSELGSCF